VFLFVLKRKLEHWQKRERKADPSVATNPAGEHRFERASALALGHACRGPGAAATS